MPDVTQRTGFPQLSAPSAPPSPCDIPPEITHLEETHRSLPIVHMLLPNGIEGESKFVLTTLSYSKEEALELNKYSTVSNSWKKKKKQGRERTREYGIDR